LDEQAIYYHLLEAMGEPGCPICRLSEHAVDSYLEHLLYADVTSVERRAEVRSAQGFCSDHARGLLTSGRALGVAIIYQDIITNLARHLEASGRLPLSRLRPRNGSGVPQPAPCPACRYYVTMQTVYVQSTVKHLENAEFRQKLALSDGLCLTHFRQALGERMDDARRRSLIDEQMARWSKLIAELGEYIRKNDYRFRSEGFGEESDAWERALLGISGGRDLKE